MKFLIDDDGMVGCLAYRLDCTRSECFVGATSDLGIRSIPAGCPVCGQRTAAHSVYCAHQRILASAHTEHYLSSLSHSQYLGRDGQFAVVAALSRAEHLCSQAQHPGRSWPVCGTALTRQIADRDSSVRTFQSYRALQSSPDKLLFAAVVAPSWAEYPVQPGTASGLGCPVCRAAHFSAHGSPQTSAHARHQRTPAPMELFCSQAQHPAVDVRLAAVVAPCRVGHSVQSSTASGSGCPVCGAAHLSAHGTSHTPAHTDTRHQLQRSPALSVQLCSHHAQHAVWKFQFAVVAAPSWAERLFCAVKHITLVWDLQCAAVVAPSWAEHRCSQAQYSG